MQDNIHNRQGIPAKRGRPTLAEQAMRDKTPLPEPVTGSAEPLFRCSRCGHDFAPRVHRTLADNVRIMRCPGCGYSHKIPVDLVAKLLKLP